MSYCVYLKRKQVLPAEPVARLISEVSGLSLADGHQMVRRCRGFLIEHLEAVSALSMVDGLKRLGIEAECRQIRELVSNPRAVTIRSGQFTSQDCIVQDW